MRELYPPGVVAVLIGEEPAVHQFIDNGKRDIRARKSFYSYLS